MLKSIQQLDGAMLEKLRGIKVRDEDGNIIEVPIKFISTDRGYEEPAKLPAIILYRNGVYPDVYGYRWDNSTYLVDKEYNENGDVIKAKEVPATQPYNAYYGVFLYYEYEEDGALMTMQVNKKLHRGSYLAIDGYGYDIEYLEYKHVGATFEQFGDRKKDEVKPKSERFLFRIPADFIMSDDFEEVIMSTELVPNFK